MKKNEKTSFGLAFLVGICFLLTCATQVVAQVPQWAMDPNYISNKNDSTNILQNDSIVLKSKPLSLGTTAFRDEDGNVLTASLDSLSMYAWRIDPKFGTRQLISLDTTYINFAQASTVEGRGLGVNFLGNIGDPMQPIQFSKRANNIDFPFINVISPWLYSAKKNIFYNTKVPYSNVEYQAGGAGDAAENRLQTVLTSNFGKKVNVGFNVDYIYSRGYYTALFNKQISYNIFASYIGERYKFQGVAGNNYSNVSVNGGIENDKYITNPESEDLASTRGNTKDIPVVFQDGIKNKIHNRYIYLTNTYELGKFYEEIADTDSTTVWLLKKNYIAPASIIYTLDYQDARRTVSTSPSSVNAYRLDSVFVPNFSVDDIFSGNTIYGKYEGALKDLMSYYSFRNLLGFSMNEGFKSWTKFGLTVYGEANFRKYLIPDDTNNNINKIESDNLYTFGARLSNTKGRYFRYDIEVAKGVNKSNMELSGNIGTFFNIAGRSTSLNAKGYIRNTPASFFQNNFSSRNWIFHNDFSDEKRVYIEAQIKFPKLSFSETEVSGSYENITDYIYLQDELIPEEEQIAKWSKFRRTPTQHSGMVNILTLKAKQKINAGAFNIELQGILQKSSNNEVIPLPTWDVTANMYFLGLISSVLKVQVGAQTHIHAPYMANGFDPLFNQFYNQNAENGIKLGNFPFTNVYINLHLKYTRFFVMLYNVTKTMGNRESFTTPHYPIDPFMFRWGLSWRFNN